MRRLLVAFALSTAAACALPAGEYEPTLDAGPDAASGLQLAPTLLDLREGATADLTVRLVTPGTADVTVDLSAATGLALSDYQLTLGAGTPSATIQVTATDDPDAEDATATVTANASGFSAVATTVTIDDDEVLAIVTDFDHLNISDTTSAVVNVTLSAKPLADVSVRAALADMSIATITQTSLRFTPDDWDQPQAISVVGIHDPDAVNESTSLQLRADTLPDKDVVVDVTDIDQLNVIGTPSMIEVTEEAPGVQFDVYLTQQPAGPVTITVSPMNPAVRVSDTQLVFDTQDYGTPQHVTVTAMGDDDVAGFTTTIRLSSATPALGYDLAVTVVDDDHQALQLVAANPFTVNEEGSATFTARLAFRPAGDIVVTAAPADPALAMVTPGSLTFRTSDYADPQTVTVTALPDADVAPETTAVQLRHTSLPNVDLPTTIVDNDTLALVVPTPPTTIVEGGTATLMVSLNYQPSAPLNVTVSSSGGAVTAPTTPLTFLPGNYTTPQPVVLTAPVDPNLLDEMVTITLASPGNLTERTFPITVDDQTQLGLVLTTTTVNVTEEGAGQTVGVSLSNPPLGMVNVTLQPSASDVSVTPSLQFDAGNWMTPQPVTISATTDDDVASESAMVTVMSAVTPSRAITVNITDDDTQSIQAPGPIAITEGGTATIGVRLAFRPAAAVDVTPSSPTPLVATVPSTILTFTPMNWSTVQNVTVTAPQDADTNPGTGTIRFTAGTLVTNTTVNVTDDDTQGIVVLSAPATIVEGTTASFQVRLNALPPGNVTVSVSSSNPAIAVVPPGNSLSFTTGTWSSPQTVTLSAPVDVNLLDETATITLSSPGNAPDVTFNTIADDQDVLAFVVSPTTVNITEQGAAATVQVSLNKQPTGAVAVSHGSSSGLATSSGTLAFNAGNWMTPQPLAISAPLDDDTAGGSATITLHAAAVPVDATITANVTDDDVQAIVHDAPPTVTTVEDALPAGDARFHVRLAFRPQANVTVGVQSLNTAVATVSTSQLTFMTSNWNVDQTVIVHGVSDPNLTGATTTVRLTGPNTVDLPVAVTDDDVQSVIVSPTSLAFGEGTSTSLMVKLAFQPSTPTTTVTMSSNNLDVTLPSSVGFTSATWNTFQTVTVAAATDPDTATDVATLTLANSEAPTPTTVPVSVSDPTIVTNLGWPTAFASANTINQGTVMAYRVTVPTTTTLDKFGLIAAAAGGDFKMALYADAGNIPGALEYQVSARQTISAAGAREVDIVDGTISAGTHWVAIRVSPSASISNSGAAMTETRCLRTVTIPSLDDPWPATFGTANCAVAAIYNLYFVTYRNP